MIQHTVDVRFNRPVDEVFAFLTNASNHARWDHLSVAMEPQEPGPWHQGLQFREVRKMGGRDTEVYSQIASFTPNQRFDIDSVSGPEFHGHWVFTAEGSQTRLQYTAELQMSGLGRLFEPLLARQFKRQLDENFGRLKQVLDSAA